MSSSPTNPHIFSMDEFDEIAGLTEDGTPSDEAEPETETEESGEEEEQAGEPEQESPQGEEEGEEGEDGEEAPEPEEEEDDTSEEAGQGEDDAGTSEEPDSDPEVQAFLAKYDGDQQAALKAGVELQKLMSRQGQENGRLRQQVEALTAELAQSQAFTQGPSFLTQEQQEWVGAAVESGNPQLYVQQAVQAGEFALARAVTDAWGEEQPYPALRAAQIIDQAEYMAQSVEPVAAPVYEHPQFIADLTAAYPEMPQYEPQMVTVVKNLGDGHPLVAASRSPDPAEAARGLIGIYEIARASSASVRTARAQVKKKISQDGQAARQAAVVTSGQATPANTETPRQRMIAPGLSLEALDAEWEAHS